MSEKQMSLESIYEMGVGVGTPNDEIAKDSKTANNKKVAFKTKYQEFYLN